MHALQNAERRQNLARHDSQVLLASANPVLDGQRTAYTTYTTHTPYTNRRVEWSHV